MAGHLTAGQAQATYHHKRLSAGAAGSAIMATIESLGDDEYLASVSTEATHMKFMNGATAAYLIDLTLVVQRIE